MLRSAWEIYDATDSMLWPGAASVTVAIVHGAHGSTRARTPARLNGVHVEEINSRLRPKPERDDPVALRANKGLAYVGSYPLGAGFELTPAKRDALVARDAKNATRIFPYLGGEEVSTSPTQNFNRYIIDLGQMSLEEAEQWPDLIRILREEVKPARERDKRDARRKYWWRFAEGAPALYAALAQVQRCLVIPQQFTNRVRVAVQPTGRVFSQKLIVLPTDRFATYAVVQSCVHNAWARLFCGRMGSANTPVYSPSECLETFPFPRRNPRDAIPALDAIGGALDSARSRYMAEHGRGLTEAYNALLDPDCNEPGVIELRSLHEEVDSTVLEAYGWGDLAVPPCCPKSDTDRAALQAFEDEVIDRLYVLNAERAREEQRMGDAAGSNRSDDERAAPGAANEETRKKRAAKNLAKEQGKLFDS